MAQGVSNESFVQVAADGAGKKVRNRPLVVLLEDGTQATVYMQVVTIADDAGRPLQLDQAQFQSDVLRELRAIARGLMQLTGENPYQD